MKYYSFQYYYSLGHGGAVGTVSVGLKDEYADQLESIMKTGKRTLQFSPEIICLYDRVMEKIVQKEMEGFEPDYLLTFAEEEDDDVETCMEHYLEACNLDIFLPGIEWDS